MIYPVSIYNARGVLQRIIPAKQLTRRYWDLFDKKEKDHDLLFARRKAEMHKKLRAYLDLEAFLDSLAAPGK